MKKWLFSICLLSVFLLAWCENKTEITPEIDNQNDVTIEQQNNIQEPDINDILEKIVKEHGFCDNDSEMFVNIAILWTDENIDWNTEYYLMTNGAWFKIDERWNLADTCGFGIPMTIELDKDNNLVRYEPAKDWGLYESSIKEMFSEEAVRKLFNEDYEFLDGRSLLEIAEEYFGVTIIPETENNFECKFCDKLRYHNPTPEDDELLRETNELHYNYISKDNWNNTIYFSSDWTFKAEWKWDAWEWTRAFGQNENTVIVLNNNLDHVYHRYIITNIDENNLNTILEIIQRR